MKYDVFISYRREGGYDTAKHLYDLLVRDGYKVSFDIDTLRSGDFDTQLLSRIDQCKDFILLIDAHAFDRTLDPSQDPKKDWLRNELAYALKIGKNVVPVFLSGVTGFPDKLPSDIADVVRKNGPEYNRYYFNDFYKTLKERFLHKKAPVNRKVIVSLLASLIVGLGVALIWPRGTELKEDPVSELPSEVKPELKQEEENQIERFCGNFSSTDPAAKTGGLNYVYELVLDPINSSCTLVEDGVVNITNSKGYCGTMMQYPEYWEVINFSMSSNGKTAIAEMIGGDNSICTVSLALDNYNNIVMTYIGGNEAPSILYNVDSDDYTRAVKFTRD